MSEQRQQGGNGSPTTTTTTTLSSIDAAYAERLSRAAGEPAWLADYRRSAAAAYARLPVETSPLYGKYTEAGRMDPSRVRIGGPEPDGGAGASGALAEPPDFLRGRIAELDGRTCAVQMGSRMGRVSLSEQARSAGLVVMPVLEAARERPAEVRAALLSSDPSEDRFTALNNAAFSSGVFVMIPPGATIDDPVHIVTCLGGAQADPRSASAISRNIVVAGEQSRATVVQELYSQPCLPPGGGGGGGEKDDAGADAAAPQPAYMELFSASVARGARLDGTTLQMMGEDSVNFSTRRTEVAADAQVNWYLGLFGSYLSRYRIDYHLAGAGASANDSEVAFGSGSQSFDLQSNANHEAPSTEARIIEKSILRDSSRSLFKGMIRIMEGASKSNSYLSGRSILLDAGAKSDAIPGLEILTNDVKATHSASVAQIDNEQIFYLQSRCLSRKEAERTIVEGFLEPLSRRMSYQVRAWIAHLIESKWEGRPLSINTDEELRRFVEVEETRYNEDAEIEQHYKYR